MAEHTAFCYSGTELAALDAAKNYHRWVRDIFRPYLGTVVAEVGAGIGSFSKLLLETSLQRLYALEPSADLYSQLVAGLAHDDRARSLNAFLDPSRLPEPVDSIIYNNVLEHIEDDVEELVRANEVLRPGGHLLVFSPAIAWLYSEFDKHVGHHRRYTKRGLVAVAERAGFRIVQARYFDLAGAALWYLAFVLLKLQPRRSSVALYDTVVVPPMRVLESIVPPPIGKNVLLVATKV
jgi:SAM-dependent methyltransferase